MLTHQGTAHPIVKGAFQSIGEVSLTDSRLTARLNIHTPLGAGLGVWMGRGGPHLNATHAQYHRFTFVRVILPQERGGGGGGGGRQRGKNPQLMTAVQWAHETRQSRPSRVKET